MRAHAQRPLVSCECHPASREARRGGDSVPRTGQSQRVGCRRARWGRSHSRSAEASSSGGVGGVPHWEPAPRPRRTHTGRAAGEARSSSSGRGEHTEGPWGQPGTFSHACPTRSWTVPSASVTFSAGSYFLQMQLMWVILVSGTHVLDQEMQRGRIRTLGATCLPRTLGAPCPPPGTLGAPCPHRDAGSPRPPRLGLVPSRGLPSAPVWASSAAAR